MTASLCVVHLIGRLGQEPALRYLDTGQCRTRLRLATDRPVRPGTEPRAEWHDVVCRGPLAECAADSLSKGRLVYVSGRLSYRTYEGRDGRQRRVAEVVAHEILPLDRRPAAATGVALAGDVIDADGGDDAAA